MPTPSSNALRIIQTKSRRVEVLASPGSGKTYTLVRRIQYLLASGVPARSILVLSFSNASVRELRRRMDLLCTEPRPGTLSTASKSDVNMSALTVQTAHACALALMRQRSTKPTILSDVQLKAAVKKALNNARRDCRQGLLWANVSLPEKKLRLQQLVELAQPLNIGLILRMLSVARAALKTVSETAGMAAFEDLTPYVKLLPAISNRFKAAKRARGQIDYGDMLAQAVTAINARSDGSAYTHILVDEYQDCSAAQVHMLAALARLPDRQIMVFGDPCQGVFGFAGSQYTPVASVLNNVKQLTLPVSWRLTAPVAALASAVVGHKPGQTIQTLRDGPLPVLVRNSGLADQTRQVKSDIQKLMADGAKPEQIVVLARTRALLAPVEAALLAVDISTQQLGKARNIKHVMAALSLIRIVERCQRQQTEITAEMLRKALPSLTPVDDSIWLREARALAKAMRVTSLEGRYRLCAAGYLRLMGGVRANAELRADLNRWEPFSRGYAHAREMRVAVRAMAPAAVVTGTIHAAKGMEWPHVLVLGVTDGLLPLYLARDTAALAEERNLLYVAITRAEQSLRLYHAPVTHARSGHQFEGLSRFIDRPSVRRLIGQDARKRR